MMGYGEDKGEPCCAPPRCHLRWSELRLVHLGIIPLTCEELFKRGQAKAASDPTYAYTVEVSCEFGIQGLDSR